MPMCYRVALFWAAALFALVMASLPQGPELPGIDSDKVQHIIAFVVLTGLALFAYGGPALGRIVAGLSAYGALIEIIQLIPALHRDGDWKDWLADTAAVVATSLVYLASRRLHSGRSRSSAP